MTCFCLFFSLRAMIWVVFRREESIFNTKSNKTQERTLIFALNQNYYADLFVWFSAKTSCYNNSHFTEKQFFDSKEKLKEMFICKLKTHSFCFLWMYALICWTIDSFAFFCLFLWMCSTKEKSCLDLCNAKTRTTFSSFLFDFLCFVCLNDQIEFCANSQFVFQRNCCFLLFRCELKHFQSDFYWILVWLISFCIVLLHNRTEFSKKEFLFFFCFCYCCLFARSKIKRNESFCANRQFFLSFFFRVSLSISLSFLVFLLVLQRRELFVFRFVVDFNSKTQRTLLILIDFEWKVVQNRRFSFVFCFWEREIERNSSSFFVWNEFKGENSLLLFSIITQNNSHFKKKFVFKRKEEKLFLLQNRQLFWFLQRWFLLLFQSHKDCLFSLFCFSVCLRDSFWKEKRKAKLCKQTDFFSFCFDWFVQKKESDFGKDFNSLDCFCMNQTKKKDFCLKSVLIRFQETLLFFWFYCWRLFCTMRKEKVVQTDDFSLLFFINALFSSERKKALSFLFLFDVANAFSFRLLRCFCVIWVDFLIYFVLFVIVVASAEKEKGKKEARKKLWRCLVFWTATTLILFHFLSFSFFFCYFWKVERNSSKRKVKHFVAKKSFSLFFNQKRKKSFSFLVLFQRKWVFLFVLIVLLFISKDVVALFIEQKENEKEKREES